MATPTEHKRGSLYDLRGESFGRLVVLERAANNSAGRVCWLCRCDCGAECTVQASNLMRNTTKSCGCINKPTMRADPTPTQLAWAAGLLDGEGCITIIVRNGDYYIPKIEADNTYEAAIRALRDIFELGSVSCVTRQTPHKDCFNWTAVSGSAILVARILQPYLRIKRAQAEVLIAFEDEALWRRGRRGVAVPESEKARRAALYLRCRQLNKRGR